MWPLLQPGQDPEGVPARVAFHLHSFGLRSTGLANVLGISARYATDYLQGRVDLTEQQAIQFARLLQVNPAELIRPLTPEEAAEWRFYRISVHIMSPFGSAPVPRGNTRDIRSRPPRASWGLRQPTSA